ncbi:MAG: choice-of-anchor L domain-containing protein [Pirellulaceae bacterium]
MTTSLRTRQALLAMSVLATIIVGTAPPTLAQMTIADRSQFTEADLAEAIVNPSCPYSAVAPLLSVIPQTTHTRVRVGGSSFLPCAPWAFTIFTGGDVQANDNVAVPGVSGATYIGGIGFEAGIVLSTGVAIDGDPVVNGAPKTGVLGPNNASAVSGGWEGELSKRNAQLLQSLPLVDEDADFVYFMGGLAPSWDTAVLEFKINIKRRGFLVYTFVHASDESPGWQESTYNDTPCCLIRREGTNPPEDFQNLVTFRKPLFPNQLFLFDLATVAECGDKMYTLNRSAFPYDPPNPPNSYDEHYVDAMESPGYFDHEFNGASKPLQRETFVTPGDYTIKIAVADIDDENIDSATFIPAYFPPNPGDSPEEAYKKLGGLRLLYLPGDYNGNDVVDAADYTVWKDSFGENVDPGTGADGNCNGTVDAADYTVWKDNFGARFYDADLNRDGVIDTMDRDIMLDFLGLTQCASRFEGDLAPEATGGDGRVDAADVQRWNVLVPASLHIP